MSRLLQLLQRRIGPDLFGPMAVSGILTATGVFTFVAGILYLPGLDLTRAQFVLSFLLLLTIALLCATLGQLFVLNGHLEKRKG